MVPGSLMVETALSASLRMLFCNSGSNFLPVWCPRGKLRKTDRGGLTSFVISRADVIDVVGMPASSMARANSPTD